MMDDPFGHGLILVSDGTVSIEQGAEFWSLPAEEKITLLAQAHEQARLFEEIFMFRYVVTRGQDIRRWLDTLKNNPGLMGCVGGVVGNPYATQTDRDAHEIILIELNQGAQRRTPDGTLRNRIIHRDRSLCRYCGTAVPKKEIKIDHIIPYSLGGLTELANLVVSCFPCNSRKAGRTPEQAGMVLILLAGGY